MTTALIILVSAAGLIILGYRVIAIGMADNWGDRWWCIKRCILDWGLALGLAFVGGITGGVVGGTSGLVAGPFLSFWIGFGRPKN